MRNVLAVAVVAVAVLVAGCGGEEGGGDEGGTGGTGGVEDPCAAACNHLAECGLGFYDCATRCDDTSAECRSCFATTSCDRLIYECELGVCRDGGGASGSGG